MADAKKVEVVLEANEAVAVIPGGASMIKHGAVAYDPKRDELVLTISQASVLRLRPGRAFSETLNALMIQADVEEGSEDAAAFPCPACGLPVLNVTVGVARYETMIDAAPSPNGIYVLTRPGKARTLRPLENPLGPTYRRHKCNGAKS